MMFAARHHLECRYDGPIPPADPARPMVAAAGRARLFQRLAAEARAQGATARRRLTAAGTAGDARLDRLQRDLRLYRAQDMLWRME